MTSLRQPLAPLTEAGQRLATAVDALGPSLSEFAAINDRDGCFAGDSLALLGDAGVLAACALTADGGGGLTSLYDLAVLTARIAEHDASVAIGLSMHFGLSWYFGRPKRAGARDRAAEIAQTWLAQIGRREMIVCSAVAEDAASPVSPQTTAVLANGAWVINGRKTSVSLCPAATHFYTRVRAETPEGPWQGSFMIARAQPGVSVRDSWHGAGMRGSGSGDVAFVDVCMPHKAFLPRGPWGYRASDDAGRAANSILIVAVYAGIAENAHRFVLGHLRRSAHTKAPAASASRVAIAELELAISTIRGTLHTVLTRLDSKITNTAPRTHAPDDATALLVESVAAGMIVERAATLAVQHAAELYGARSYMRGGTLERLSRDVRAAAFMRPYAPADGWTDFLAESALR